ncbi:MAG: NAD(P)-dependent oxidoreductase, partial [Rhizobiaceae bacterium]
AGGSAVRIHVEMSTLGKEAMETIAGEVGAKGVGFLDAPISGGPGRAREGALTAIVAGDPQARAFARPVLDKLARNVFEVGDAPGQAQVVKLVNNMLSITAFVASCEAISVGVKAGLDARTMIDVINASTGRNSATVDKFPAAILPRKFQYGGPLSIGVKDSQLFLDLARSAHMPAFVGSTVANLFAMIAEQLGPEQDYSNTIKVFEAWGGGIVVGDHA